MDPEYFNLRLFALSGAVVVGLIAQLPAPADPLSTDDPSLSMGSVLTIMRPSQLGRMLH